MSNDILERFAFKAPKDISKEQLEQLLREHSGDPNYLLPKGYFEKWQELNEREDQKMAILKEIAGDCGKKQDHSQKKKHEINLMANFIFDVGLNAKIVDCEESPDFIIELNGERIGVELTSIFDDEVVASINGFQKKLDEALDKLKAKDPNITGLFNFTIDPAKVVLRNRNIADEIVAYVAAKIANEELPNIDGLAFVSNTPHKVLEFAVSEQYNLADLDIENVKTTIKKKEEKFLAYKENTGLERYWLLISHDGASAKGSFKFDISRLPMETGTNFDTVYFYDEMKKMIISGKNTRDENVQTEAE
ncbi:MAG: hypothetical protein H3C54_13690 [Taibaiella sp.]|nr:hypothetical protein [Taibaiella sp.]